MTYYVRNQVGAAAPKMPNAPRRMAADPAPPKARTPLESDVGCPECGSQYPKGTKVCTKCDCDLAADGSAPTAAGGAPVACPECKAANPAGSKFCNVCGAAVAPDRDVQLAAAWGAMGNNARARMCVSRPGRASQMRRAAGLPPLRIGVPELVAGGHMLAGAGR
jgi:ribosomal protein L40E